MDKQPLVSCVLITYNSSHFLKTFFEGLLAQQGVRMELIVIDNASSDESFVAAETFVHADGKAFFERVECIKNEKNLGYSGAAEQGVRAAHGEYVLIVNPDIILKPTYVAELVAAMQLDATIGSASGKLLKFDFAQYFKSHNSNASKTNVIDSAGLIMYKSRRCVDRGQGVRDEGQFDLAEEVFGVTGAAPLYRKSALLDAEVGGHVFDPDFFMYKEDVDVAWRLRLMKWSSWYLPKAIAYHGRGTGATPRESIGSVMKNRATLPRFTKHHSYRNERVLRLRNEFIRHVIQDFLPITWRELMMLGWMLVREPYLVKSFGEFVKKIPRTLRHRKELLKKIRATPREIRRWFR